ncbi:MAG: energy transducer TonB [Acidobacteriota bacterium]
MPPKVLTQTIPSYTEEARLGGVEGDVVLRCIIRTTGRVTDCQVVQSPGSGLAEVSIKEIQDNWRFSPATVDGKPVDLRAKIELTFNLRLRDGELPVSEAEGLAIERVELIGLKEEPAASVRALLQMQESSRFQKSAFESDVNRLREKFKSVSWEVSKGSSGGVVVKYRFDRR